MLRPTRTDATTDYYDIAQTVTRAGILPGLTTELWTYNGSFPGPTIRSTRGRTVKVRHTNNLPVPTVVHLHGGRTPQDSDGYPIDYLYPTDMSYYARHHDPTSDEPDDDDRRRHPRRPPHPHLPAGSAGRDPLVPRPPHGLHRSQRLARTGRLSTCTTTTRKRPCACPAATATCR